MAYKVCMNQSAALNYIIEPLYGVLEAVESVVIEIRTRKLDGDRVGGFCQKTANRDKLEIKTIESLGVSTKKEICKFWNVAELRFPNLIHTTTIKTFKVLEPCNMSILKILDEGEERTFLQNALENKYNNVLFPQMTENRELHSVENERIILENRTKNIWRRLQPLNLCTSRPFLYSALLFFLIITQQFDLSSLPSKGTFSKNNVSEISPVYEMVLDVNKDIIKYFESRFF